MINSEVLGVKRIIPNYIDEAKRKWQEFQLEMAERKREKANIKAKKIAKKQAEKDDARFLKIREKLMNKVFENYEENVLGTEKKAEEYKKHIAEFEENNQTTLGKFQNADGAIGIFKTAKANKKLGKITLWNSLGVSASAAVSSLVQGGAVQSSIVTSALQCLSPASAFAFATSFFVPPLAGPIVGIAASAFMTIAMFIRNKKQSKASNVGLYADAIEKEQVALADWEVTCKKISELNDMFLKDKAKLLEMQKKNKGKKNFDKILDEYLYKTLAPKIKELNLDLPLTQKLKEEFVQMDVNEDIEEFLNDDEFDEKYLNEETFEEERKETTLQTQENKKDEKNAFNELNETEIERI